jgi:hypothetical protein
MSRENRRPRQQSRDQQQFEPLVEIYAPLRPSCNISFKPIGKLQRIVLGHFEKLFSKKARKKANNAAKRCKMVQKLCGTQPAFSAILRSA